MESQIRTQNYGVFRTLQLKQFRRIATHYDKTRKSFLAFLNLAAVKLYLPSFVSIT